MLYNLYNVKVKLNIFFSNCGPRAFLPHPQFKSKVKNLIKEATQRINRKNS